LSLIIAIVAAILFLEWPWNLLVVAGAALWEGFEIFIFLRWRKRKPISGPDALLGVRGVSVSSCRPDGQARIAGRFWRVICDEGAEPGDPVVVDGIAGTTLHVRRAAEGSSGTAAS
jgi:membrane protein implicated in regulation of membrane protease activity